MLANLEIQSANVFDIILKLFSFRSYDERASIKKTSRNIYQTNKKKYLYQSFYSNQHILKYCFAVSKPLPLKSASQFTSSARFSLSLCYVSFIHIVYNKFCKFLYHELHLHVFHIYISSFRSRFASKSDEERSHLIIIFRSFPRSSTLSFRELFIKLCHVKSTSITSSANLYIISFLHIFIPTTLRPY